VTESQFGLALPRHTVWLFSVKSLPNLCGLKLGDVCIRRDLLRLLSRSAVVVPTRCKGLLLEHLWKILRRRLLRRVDSELHSGMLPSRRSRLARLSIRARVEVDALLPPRVVHSKKYPSTWEERENVEALSVKLSIIRYYHH
jgi:hypothetical protein